MARPQLLILIAALARNRVIGRDNALLWSLPEDMAHFRRSTQGCPVIMGRKTWESLPERFRPLPGRRNVVLSRNADFLAAGAETVTSLEAALDKLADAPKVFVIGGEQLYRLALPWADQLLLTELHRDFEGDAYFPAWDAESFVEVDRRAGQCDPGQMGYDFVHYERRGDSGSAGLGVPASAPAQP